jgi:hypothetical protein
LSARYAEFDDSYCNRETHGIRFLSQERRQENSLDAIAVQESLKAYANHQEPKINSKSPHARQAHAGFAVSGSDFPIEATVM